MSTISFQPVSLELVRRLNRIATEGCVSVDENGHAPEAPVDWKRYERQHPTLKKLRGAVTEKLANLGIYMFVVGNRSGWGDAPADEVGRAFDRHLPLLSKGAWLDVPVIVGDLKIDHDSNDLNYPMVLCSLHTGIANQPMLEQAFLVLMKKELGDLFVWDETGGSSMLIKLDPKFDEATWGFKPNVKHESSTKEAQKQQQKSSKKKTSVKKNVSIKKKIATSVKKKKPVSTPELDAQIELRKTDNKIYNPNTGNWISARSSLAYQLFERMANYKKSIYSS